MGILVLFNQDRIKKPSEQITNYKLLGIEDDTELELIEQLVSNSDYDQEKIIDLLSGLLSGNREEVGKKVAIDLICNRYHPDDYDYRELPECFRNIISEQEFELQLKGESNDQNDL